MRAPKGDFAWNVARIAAAGNAHIWPPAGLSLARGYRVQPEAERPPGGPPWPGARGSGSGAPPNGLSRSKRLYVRAQSVDRVIHSGGDPDQHVQILAHVAHLPDDAVELTRSRDALVVLNQPLRYVAPLRRMQGIIFRGADKLPEWRSRLDQPLVEGRGGGIARLAWPVG
jgi:hypothetical protein